MKKILAFVLLLSMIFSCVSCMDTDFILNTSSQSDSMSQSQNQSSEQTASSESESSSVSESDTVESSKTGDESESSSSETESGEVILPEITEYNGFSTVNTTTQSADRLKQMEKSLAKYNTGSNYSASELSQIASNARKIKTVGSLTYKNAASFMEHFLSNTGEQYQINIKSFLEDSTALANRNADINRALRACEELAVEGETVNLYQMEESLFHNLQGDWKYAVGSYFTSIEVKNLRVDGNIYYATIVFKVTDYYNWDASDADPVFPSNISWLVGDVSPKDLHQLHLSGQAKEFLAYGEQSYNVVWFKGASAESITSLK